MRRSKSILPLAIWVGVGAAIVLATDNLALWLGLGVVFGVISGYLMSRDRSDRGT